MSFAKNLARLMETRGVDQSELARRLKISSQAVNQWVKRGTHPTHARAQMLADVLGVSMDDLFADSSDGGPPMKCVEPQDGPTIIIPELAVNPQAGSGGGMPPLDGNGDHIVLAEWVLPAGFFGRLIRNTDYLRLLEIRGDSMQPDYMAGDKVLVDISQRGPTPPGIYVLWDGFGLVLKRVEVMLGRTPPAVMISSINPNYASYECLLADISIGGRVVGKWDWK